MKRVISILLVIVMLCSSFAGLQVTSHALSSSGSCGDKVTYTFNSSTGELVISGSGAMTDYPFYPNSPFENQSGIKIVIIKSGVTSIGDKSFDGCSGLTSITIPNSVTSIGWCAFGDCSGLTSITIPDSVTSIGFCAFYGCSGLTSITIPNSVTSIGDGAFENCSNLTSVTIGNSVTSIGDGAFENCSCLTSITIPNSVTSIGDWAFENCSNLTSVTIGNSVTSIGDGAFENCSCLTSITIPDSVTSIGWNAFTKCSLLTNITIPDSVTHIGRFAFWNTDYYNKIENWKNEALYINHALIEVKASLVGDFSIKSGTICISTCAFYGCNDLTSITIPNSVTNIEGGAFINCNGLKDVYYTGNQDQWNVISILDGNECLTNANIHYESVLLAPNGFTLYRDNNKYYHHNCLDKNGYFYPEDSIQGKYTDYGFFGKTTHYITNDLVKAQLYNLSYSNGRLSVIQDRMDERWSGSCYGIAATLGLVYNKTLGMNDIDSFNANNYYSSVFPYKNTKLCDAIEFYYLSQFLAGYGTDSQLCTSGIKNIFTNSSMIDHWNSYLMNDFYKLLINEVSKNSTLLLGYSHQYIDEEGKTKIGGHAIITCGIEQLQDGTYDIWLYDENCIDHFDHLYLKSNSGYFDVKYKCGNDYTNLPNELLTMFYLPLDNRLGDIYPLKNSAKQNAKSRNDSTTVILNANDGFRINDSKNTNILTCKDGNIDSESNILNVRFITGGGIQDADAYYEITLDKTNDLEYTATTDHTDIAIFDNNEYSSVKGEGIESISFSDLNSLSIQGSDYSFEASLNRTEQQENQLVSINANAKKDVDVSINKQDEIILTSEDEVTDVAIDIIDSDDTIRLEANDSKTIKICSGEHDFVTQTIQANCKQQGYTLHSCKNCDCFYKDNIIQRTAHSYKNMKVVKPTTIKAGYSEQKCSVCGTTRTVCTAPTGKVKTVKCKARTATAETMTWSAIKGAQGYQIQISTKDGKSWDKTYNAKTKTNYTIKSLAAGGTYKFRVRIYAKGVDGKYYFGPWTKAVTSPTLPSGTSLKKLTPAKKAFTAQWKKNTTGSGYQIQYSTKSNFAGAKKVTVKSNKTLKATVKKLSAKKVYYVRIRTYKTISKANYYSAWSKTYKVKTK